MFTIKITADCVSNKANVSNVEFICICCVCYRDNYSLVVHKTSLQSLGLVSLRSIENGNVCIAHNTELCYLKGIPWPEILRQPSQTSTMSGNKADVECGWFYILFSFFFSISHCPMMAFSLCDNDFCFVPQCLVDVSKIISNSIISICYAFVAYNKLYNKIYNKSATSRKLYNKSATNQQQIEPM